MKHRLRSSSALWCVVFLLMRATSASAQCQPSLQTGLQLPTSTVYLYVDPSIPPLDPLRTYLAVAAQEVNAQLAAGTSNGRIQIYDAIADLPSGVPGIPIYRIPEAQMGEDWASVQREIGTHILRRVNFSTAINDYDPDGRLAQYVAFHELMHVAGFDEVTSPGCTGQTVMFKFVEKNINWILANLPPPNEIHLKPTDIQAIRDNGPSSGGGGDDPPPGEDPPSEGGDPGDADFCVRFPWECSPLLLDLGRRGLEMSEPDVPFDFWGNGHVGLYSWPTAESGNGWLVLDRNGDGMVNDASELFGNATPLSWTVGGTRAANGFEALGWFDRQENGGNGDGVIDCLDAVYEQLRVWIDANHDGVSEPGELHSLANVGVESISLAVGNKQRIDRYGNYFAQRSEIVLLRGGIREWKSFIYDVWFGVNRRAR